MGWKPLDKIAVALQNFKANGLHQLSIHVGDLLYVQEQLDNGEWCRGYFYYEPSKKGIFPTSYICMKESTRRNIGSQTIVVPAGDELLVEATQGLREWRWKLRELYVRGSRERWRPLYHAMEEVVNWRRALASSNTTLEALQETRVKLSATIDEINRQSGCPLTPRDPATGAAVDCQKTSILELWKLHRDRRADSTSDHAPSTLRRQNKSQPHSHLHHLFVRVDLIDHAFTEDCEIFFFITGGGREQLSERYVVTGEKGGGNKPRQSCVFTDLGSKDMEKEVYLICQIIRIGKMLQDKKHHSSHTFRRPYAVGVLDVRTILHEPDTADSADLHRTITMPLYLCGTNHESNFATFYTTIIQKTGAKGGQKPGCAITLSLRAFHRKQLSVVRMETPMLFTKATQIVHKLGFPDVILPGDARNDIYVTLEGGSFSKGTKTAERNVEVVVCVVDNSGTVIQKAIVKAAGAPPAHEYISYIFYHNNNPKWKETFKLVVPFEKVPDAHLRIVFRHLAKDEAKGKSEKSFAYAYLKIMNDDGSIISDGSHDLFVSETSGRKWTDPSSYSSLPMSRDDTSLSGGSTTTKGRKTLTMRGSSSPAQSVRGVKETVTISTLTCSTKLTQRIELLLLLKWRQKSRDLSVVLRNLVHVGGEEVVKFLQDTLDCLFEILNDSHEKYGELVFGALVSIFGLMCDDRYHHFTTVLDIYIEKHFSALLAHKYLLASFKKNVKELMYADLQQQKLINILKSMPYLFKFIVQSSHLYHKQRKAVDPSFISDFSTIFSLFDKLMVIPDTQVKNVHVVQKVMLEYFPEVLPELLQVYSHPEIGMFVAELLDSVQNRDIVVIPQQKLVFISSIVQSPVRLLDNEGARKQLVPTIVAHLISFMNHQMPRTAFKQDNRGNQEAVHCLGQLLSCLSNHQLHRSTEDILFVVPLLLPLLKLCKDIPRNNKLSSPNMVNFMMLLSLMTDDHFKSFYLSQQSHIENNFGPLVLDLMEVLQIYVQKPSYPNDWCTLYLTQNRVLSRAIVNCSEALVLYALDDAEFAPSIWDKFFSLCAVFLTQPCLQLERLSDYRNHSYQQLYGDIRVSLGRHVVTLWHKLGDKKGNFIPNLVKPFLEISLIKHKELRRTSLPLIMDIMECEQRASCNIKRVETEVYDKIDELITSGCGDEEYRELFQDILRPMCATNELETAGEVFISSVSRLIGLLLDYRNVSSDDGHKDRRMGCMLNLLNFYREIEKEELYIRYIYKLAELHVKDGRFTEAGFTLLLRAKGLEWSIEPVPPEGKFQEEVEQKEVKEELYKEVIDLFDKGQDWEHGIPLCKELCSVYETEIQYNQLATTLQREAEFFQKIVRELRVEPEYFMVGSYGKGFPLFLRNKIYIHRGLPYERLSSFIKRLTDEFSTAELLKTTKPPDDDIKNSTGMFLQVRSVQAIPEEIERFEGKTVPDSVSRYYKANDVSKFRYDRPFHRGEKRKDCEIATLWIERTNFVTTKPFPGEMAWFEVDTMEQVELDPLAIAIETVSSKIGEVRTLTTLHSENKNLNINPLSMLLNGLIDAAVGGGIKNYRIVFFNDEYTASNHDDRERVQQLKQLIEEQLSVLRKGLDVHGKRIAPALKGMQLNLEEKLEMMVFEVFPEKRRKPVRSQTVKNAPLPPIPQSESSPPSHTQTMNLPRRRGTGKNKNRISQLGESPPPPPSSGLQRSATTRLPSESSPKPPLPYLPPKRTDDVKRLSGSGSAISEEEDGGAYESVDDFLRRDSTGAVIGFTGGPTPVNVVVPQRPPSAQQRPPLKHDYTPVKVEGGGVQVGREEEKDDIVVAESRPPKPSPLPKKRLPSGSQPPPPHPPQTLPSPSPSSSSVTSPRPILPPLPAPLPAPSSSSSMSSSSPPPHSSRSPPTPRFASRALENADGGGGGGTEQRPSLPPKRRKSAAYSEPDTSKWKNSPPKVPPPVPEDIYSYDTLSKDALAAQATPTTSRPSDDDNYNHLTVTPSNNTGNSPRSTPGHSPSPGAPPINDDVYFNHLAEPLPPSNKPSNKPHPPAPPPTSLVGEGGVYFDHLAGPLPPNQTLQEVPQQPRRGAGDTVPPPLPMKKNKPPQKQYSVPEALQSTPEKPIPRRRTESQHPIPVPRNTSPATDGNNTPATTGPPATPSRPPKPGVPSLPPKPSIPTKPSTKPIIPPKESDAQVPPRPPPLKNKPFT